MKVGSVTLSIPLFINPNEQAAATTIPVLLNAENLRNPSFVNARKKDEQIQGSTVQN